MTKDEEVQRIEDALDALLTAVLAHEEAMPDREPRLVSMQEIAADLDFERDDMLDWIFDDPIGGALRLGIRLCGERLHKLLGSTGKMGQVAHRVADRDPEHADQRIDILDKRWDGIGSGDDVWSA